MSAPDRYTVRNMVNTLADLLLDEGVSRKRILEYIEEYAYPSEEDMKYFDLRWLKEET